MDGQTEGVKVAGRYVILEASYSGVVQRRGETKWTYQCSDVDIDTTGRTKEGQLVKDVEKQESC